MKKAFIILLFLLPVFVCKQATAQTSDGEQQIKYYLEQIQYWRFQYSPEDSGVNPDANPHDSLLAMNMMLVKYLADNPALLRTSFKTLGEEITIATSDDKKIRFYSWDTETGDEAHVYNTVAQYETTSGTKSKTFNDISAAQHDAGKLYTIVYTEKGSKPLYVVPFTSIVSTKDAVKGAIAYTITNNELSTAVVFGNESKIEYQYDYFSNYDYKGMKEKILLHMEKDKLFVPVAEDDKLNGKWTVWGFSGDRFVLEQ